MLQRLRVRGQALYPRVYLQFAALMALLIAAEFSMSTFTMMLTQRALYRVSQKKKQDREVLREEHDDQLGGNCCA